MTSSYLACHLKREDLKTLKSNIQSAEKEKKNVGQESSNPQNYPSERKVE